MTEKQTAIYFGNKYININFKTNEEKAWIEQFAKKFNKEFNNLLCECGREGGRVNSRILLFFLLLKTQVEIIEYQTGKIDLDLAIKEIAKFICDKNSKETALQIEVNPSEIEGQLAIGNLFKDAELAKVKGIIANKPQSYTEEDIQSIVDHIFDSFKEKFKALDK